MDWCCPLCASRQGRRLPDKAAAYTLVQCAVCDLVFCPDAAVAEATYPFDYLPRRTVWPRRDKYAFLRWRLKRWVLADHKGYPWPGSRTAYGRLLTRLLLPLTRQVPHWQPGGRLLDVGCGGGTYLRAMRELGWEVYGVEPDGTAAARAKGASGAVVWQSALEEASLPSDYFHVVTLWHVLEHLRRPMEGLAVLRRALVKQGGLLMLEVPNFAGPGWWLFAGRWFHLDVPRHAFALTPTTLRRMLYTAGFHNIHIAHIGNAPGIVGSLGRRFPNAGWLDRRPVCLAALLGTAALAALGWGECLQASAAPVP